MSSRKRQKSGPARRVDRPASSEAPPPHAEVQAVQLERPVLVKTRHGEQLASPGEWLVTEADGTVQVFTDRAFRLDALRQQLWRLLRRSQSHG